MELRAIVALKSWRRVVRDPKQCCVIEVNSRLGSRAVEWQYVRWFTLIGIINVGW